MADHPWLKSYPEGQEWGQEFTPEPLYKIFDHGAATFPDNAFLTFFGKTLTYGEVAPLVDRAAKGFQDLGVEKGTRVGIFMANCPVYVIAYFGILKAGGIVVNMSPLYSEPELEHLVNDSGAEFLITLDSVALLPTAEAVFRGTDLKALVIASVANMLPTLKGWGYRITKRDRITKFPQDPEHVRWRDLLDNAGNYQPCAISPAEDVAVLQYTGGTTGRPKGAMLTHANIYVNVQQTITFNTSLVPGEERVLAVLPFFHVFAMTIIMNTCTYLGGELVILPKFELEDALRLIRERKITFLPAVPAMYSSILAEPDLKKADFASLTTCVSGGAPLPGDVRERFSALVGGTIREGYGLSETSPAVTGHLKDGPDKSGSVGMPIPATEILIIDREDGETPMPVGENGEICVRGPQVMKGYWQKPDATAETLRDGRLHTGDVGYLDEDGYLYIVDRIKDLILVGGFNAYPSVIEDALYEHPAVREATVIGIPDDMLGEVPKAFIALQQDAEGVDAATLKDFLRDRVGKHEMPRAFEFRDELPKTPVGKLSKKELVAEEKAKYEGTSGSG